MNLIYLIYCSLFSIPILILAYSNGYTSRGDAYYARIHGKRSSFGKIESTTRPPLRSLQSLVGIFLKEFLFIF